MRTMIAVLVCWVLRAPPRTHTDRQLFGAVVPELAWLDEGVLVGIQWEAWLRRSRQHFLVSPLVPIDAITVI